MKETILDTIVARKREEIRKAKTLVSAQELSKMALFERPTVSLSKNLSKAVSPAIIAEFKRQSPSKGIINDRVHPVQVGLGYEAAGAGAMSVLTDTDFFGGSAKDLLAVREAVQLPLLRKDFMVDEYQILEAKACGADIILLIAACLDPKALKQLAAFARSLELDVLLEVHNKEELLDNLIDDVTLIGVNNRNLKDFSLQLDHSYALAELIPDCYAKVSESGISDPKTVKELSAIGYKAFLMGENFMKMPDPGKACADFILACQ